MKSSGHDALSSLYSWQNPWILSLLPTFSGSQRSTSASQCSLLRLEKETAEREKQAGGNRWASHLGNALYLEPLSITQRTWYGEGRKEYWQLVRSASAQKKITVHQRVKFRSAGTAYWCVLAHIEHCLYKELLVEIKTELKESEYWTYIHQVSRNTT